MAQTWAKFSLLLMLVSGPRIIDLDIDDMPQPVNRDLMSWQSVQCKICGLLVPFSLFGLLQTHFTREVELVLSKVSRRRRRDGWVYCEKQKGKKTMPWLLRRIYQTDSPASEKSRAAHNHGDPFPAIATPPNLYNPCPCIHS